MMLKEILKTIVMVLLTAWSNKWVFTSEKKKAECFWFMSGFSPFLTEKLQDT